LISGIINIEIHNVYTQRFMVMEFEDKFSFKCESQTNIDNESAGVERLIEICRQRLAFTKSN